MQNTNMEDTIDIDLQEIFGLLLHWLWLIVLCGLVTGAAGFLISKFKFVRESDNQKLQMQC